MTCDDLQRVVRHQARAAFDLAGGHGYDREAADYLAMRAAVDVCTSAGAQVLGVGSTRVAVAFAEAPGVVFKLNWTAQDVNRQEADVWPYLTATQAALVAPLLDLSPGGVLAQRRADPLGPQLTAPLIRRLLDPATAAEATHEVTAATAAAEREHGPAIRELQRRFGHPDWRRGGARVNTYGLLDGRLVLLDLRANIDAVTPATVEG
jgi:hypothetical protein